MEPEIEEENSNIEQVVQYQDGSIDLKFIRSKSFNQAFSSKSMSFSRPSISRSVEEREVTLEDIERELKGVDFIKTIPNVEFDSTNFTTKKSISRTTSEMLGVRDSQCMIRSDVIVEPDFEYLYKLWNNPKNFIKKEWYKQKY